MRTTLGRAFNSASDMAPDPQPISMNRIWIMSSHCCKMSCTSSSVSGRGMNTGGVIFSTMSQKSHSPMMYCTGIRAIRHSHSCSKCSHCAVVSEMWCFLHLSLRSASCIDFYHKTAIIAIGTNRCAVGVGTAPSLPYSFG